MNRPFELGRSRMDGLGQGERLMADLERLERTQVSLHAAAHIAITGVVRHVAAEMHLHARYAVFVVVQRPFDHALNPKNEFLAAIDVLIRVDPNLHHGFKLNSLLLL